MAELLGPPLFEVWQQLRTIIDEKYDMEQTWSPAERIEFTSISTGGAARPSAAYTPNRIALGFW